MRDPRSATRSGLSEGMAVLSLEMVMFEIFEPGMLVRHPVHDDWGLGQVQSRIGARITVNFENVGKVVIDGRQVELVLVIEPGD